MSEGLTNITPEFIRCQSERLYVGFTSLQFLISRSFLDVEALSSHCVNCYILGHHDLTHEPQVDTPSSASKLR